MKLRFWPIVLIATLMPVIVVAGSVRQAGDYELLSDVTLGAGSAQQESGDYALYQSVGQPVGHDAYSGDTYELFGGFLGVVDETPPTIGITAPVADSSIGGALDVTGTVFDANDVQWLVDYGPGSTPADWTQIGSGTANAAAATLASWDTTKFGGGYTARLTAVDDRGNTTSVNASFVIINAKTVSGTVPVHKWVLAAVPVALDSTVPTSLYGQSYEYKIYRWNPDKEPTQDGGRYEYPDALSAGLGYWVKVYHVDMAYSYSGTGADTTEDFSLSLKEGWNQVGTPYFMEYPWNQVKVKHNGSTYDLDTAAQMGLISDTMTAFDNNQNSWTQHDETTLFESGRGYNVRAYEDVELLFDHDVATSASRPSSRVVRRPFSYRVRISARASESADLDNYFGSAPDAAASYDRYDLEEPYKAPGGKFTSLFFPHDDWSHRAGRYTNDVRKPAMSKISTEEWLFTVETNETGETVHLEWSSEKLPADVYSFTLINLETEERIDMVERAAYEFTVPEGDVARMQFKIEVKKTLASIVVKSVTLDAGWNLISVPLDPEVTDVLTQLGDDLTELNVYQYFDGRFYAAESADVQAGIGYWVHVPEDTEIDVQGIPSASEISVPVRQGWNLIGNPFDASLAWNDNVTFTCGEDNYTLSEAVEATVTDGKIYDYTDDGYVQSDELTPWRGYVLKMKSSCDLKLKL